MDPTGGMAGIGLLVILVAVIVSLFVFPWQAVLTVGVIVLAIFMAFVLYILSNARYT